VEINEQIAERDLVATRKTLRGTHRGELWGNQPTGNVVSLEFIDIIRMRDGKLVEHWTSMDIAAAGADGSPIRLTPTLARSALWRRSCESDRP